VIAVNFNQVSVLALPANLLVLPAIPLATLLSAITALAGSVAPALGVTIGHAAWLIITYVLSVVEAFAALPWASLSVGQFPVALAWLYYLGVGLVAILAWRPQFLKRLTPTGVTASRARFALMGCLAFAAALSWVAALGTPTDDVSVTFLNVGQGYATLIKTAHRTVLVDGGPKSGVLEDALGRRLPFWQSDVDLVVVTHGDADHVAGLVELPRRYHVGQVLQPDSAEGTAMAGPYGAWLNVLHQQGIKVVTASAGQTIQLDDNAELAVLYPFAGSRAGTASDNERSTALRLTCQGLSFLMLGDAGADAQRALVGSAVDLKSAVLMVPHHGAEGTVSPELLRAVDPSIAVISVGSDNRYGHPAASTLRQMEGRKVYRTDVDGSIEVAVRGSQCWVKTGGQ
jgi:competence protein ComEC